MMAMAFERGAADRAAVPALASPRLQQWIRLFLCQVEAVETAIWLTKVAAQIGKAGERFLDHLVSANKTPTRS